MSTTYVMQVPHLEFIWFNPMSLADRLASRDPDPSVLDDIDTLREYARAQIAATAFDATGLDQSRQDAYLQAESIRNNTLRSLESDDYVDALRNCLCAFLNGDV